MKYLAVVSVGLSFTLTGALKKSFFSALVTLKSLKE